VELLISSSGNAAYSVAFLTLGTNAKVHVFTDKLSPPEMVERLLALPHVTVRVIDEPDATGSHARARKKALQDYQQKHPRAIDVDQYSQSDWGCGYFSLPAELETQVGDIGSILIAVGTGATLRAIAQYKLKRSLRWPIFAVDALGSALNGEPCGKRVFSGYGNGAQTEWVRQALPHVAEWIRVPDEAVVSASQWLIRRGHFLGPSSCAVLAAASYMISKCRLPHTGRTVLVMPDGGAMYRSTLYNDDFLMEHGFRPSMP
jgi:cysteine synthase